MSTQCGIDCVASYLRRTRVKFYIFRSYSRVTLYIKEFTLIFMISSIVVLRFYTYKNILCTNLYLASYDSRGLVFCIWSYQLNLEWQIINTWHKGFNSVEKVCWNIFITLAISGARTLLKINAKSLFCLSCLKN